MRKCFRTLALIMAMMTALGVFAAASAVTVTNYVGTTTVVDNDFFYQGPGTNYSFVQGQNRVEKGTDVIVFGITDDGKWAYIGFDVHLGYVRVACLDDKIELKNGTTDSIKAMLAQSGVGTTTGTIGGSTVGGSTASGSTAATTGVIYNCTEWVSLRATANSGSTRIAKLTPNTSVTITGEENGYYKVTAGNYNGYVLKSYVKVASATVSGSGSTVSGSNTTTANSTGVIYNCTNWVSLRSAANSNSTRVAKLTPNTGVTIIGEQNGYYKVTVSGYTGYVLKSYVKITTTASGTTSGSTSGTVSGSTGGYYIPGQGWVSGSGTSVSGGSSSIGTTNPGYSIADSNWNSTFFNGKNPLVGGGNSNSTGSTGAAGSTGSIGTIGSVGSTLSIGTAETTGSINFRTGPGTNYGTISGCTKIPKGSTVTLIEYVSSNGGWYKVTYANYTGYASASYLKLKTTTGSTTSGTTSGSTSGTITGSTWNSGWGTSSGSSSNSSSASTTTGVTTGKVNFRTGPSTSYGKVSGCNQVPKGATVTILEDASKNNGWYKVSYNGYTGYLSESYVSVGGTAGVNTPGSTGASVSNVSAGGTQYASYTGTSSDIWGSMKVAGTNINDNIYCNALNNKGQFVYNAYSSSYNYLYALSYVSDPIAVIYGHNMRKVAKSKTSGLGLHELHHVQNAWLGKSKCEYCGRSCSGAKTSTFNINYNGVSNWTLVGFFELSSSTMSSSSERKKIQNYASFQSTLTGSAKQKWIDTMLSYCNSKYLGATLSSASSSDKIMVLITCADKSGNNNQSLYMILKG